MVMWPFSGDSSAQTIKPQKRDQTGTLALMKTDAVDPDMTMPIKPKQASVLETDMHVIADKAFNMPLPPGWSKHMDKQGGAYFHNHVTGKSTSRHPLDDLVSTIATYPRVTQGAVGGLRQAPDVGSPAKGGSWESTAGWRANLAASTTAREQHDQTAIVALPTGTHAAVGSATTELSFVADPKEVNTQVAIAVGGSKRKPLSSAEMLEYVASLGIDPVREADMLWIADAAFDAPLPPGWSEHTDKQGNVYFYNQFGSESSWRHPMDELFRDIANYQRRVQATGGFWEVEDDIADIEESLRSDLADWLELFDQQGERFFYNRKTDESRFDDPRQAQYNNLLVRIRMVAHMKERLPALAVAPRPEDPTPQEVLMQRLKEEEDAKYLMACIRVQSWVRAWAARRRVRALRAQDTLQNGPQPLRGQLRLRMENVGSAGKKELVLGMTTGHRRNRAATRIQARVRGVLARKQFRPAIFHRTHRMRCATQIQSMVRMWAARKFTGQRKEERRLKKTLLIQTCYRGYRDRQYVKALRAEVDFLNWMLKCILTVQCGMRARLAANAVRRKRQKRHTAAINEIKRHAKVWLAQRELRRRTLVERPVQCVLEFTSNEEDPQLCSLVPWSWRVLAAPWLGNEEEGIFKTPGRFRNLFKEPEELMQLEAATKMQSVHRGMLGRRRARERQAFGALLVRELMQGVYAEVLERAKATTRVQQIARGRAMRQRDILQGRYADFVRGRREQLATLGASARKYSAQAWLQRGFENQAAAKIQAHWVGRQQRAHMKQLTEELLWPSKGFFQYDAVGRGVVSVQVRFLPNPTFNDYSYFLADGGYVPGPGPPGPQVRPGAPGDSTSHFGLSVPSGGHHCQLEDTSELLQQLRFRGLSPANIRAIPVEEHEVLHGVGVLAAASAGRESSPSRTNQAVVEGVAATFPPPRARRAMGNDTLVAAPSRQASKASTHASRASRTGSMLHHRVASNQRAAAHLPRGSFKAAASLPQIRAGAPNPSREASKATTACQAHLCSASVASKQGSAAGTPTAHSADSVALRSNASAPSIAMRQGSSSVALGMANARHSSTASRQGTKVPKLEDNVYLHPETPFMHVVAVSPRMDPLERPTPAASSQGMAAAPRETLDDVAAAITTLKGPPVPRGAAGARRGAATPTGNVRATTPIGPERPPGSGGTGRQAVAPAAETQRRDSSAERSAAEEESHMQRSRQGFRQEQWERRQRFAEKEKAKFEVQLLKSREAVKASISGAPMQQPVQQFESSTQHLQPLPNSKVQHVVHQETHYVHYHMRGQPDKSTGARQHYADPGEKPGEWADMRSPSAADLQQRLGSIPRVDSGAATPKKRCNASAAQLPFTKSQGPSQASTQHEWTANLSPGHAGSVVRLAGGRGKKRFS